VRVYFVQSASLHKTQQTLIAHLYR